MRAHLRRDSIHPDMNRTYRQIASAFHPIPAVLFQLDFFGHARCNVAYGISLACFHISKNHVRIAIAAHFHCSEYGLYLLGFDPVFPL